MKKLAFLLLACMIIVSCKKDSHNIAPQTKINAKKYAVKFSVAQFNETVTQINAAKTRHLSLIKNDAVPPIDTTTLGRQLYQYYYIVYDNAGNEIRRILRNSGTQIELIFHSGPAYGALGITGLREYTTTDPYNIITDSLAAGTYTVVLAATSNENGIGINDNDSQLDFGIAIYSLLPQAVVYAGQGLDAIPRSQDLFFSKSTLVVGDQNVTSNVTMNRVVGQLEVDLQDAVPANVAYIYIGRQNEDGGYLINTGTSAYADEFVDDFGALFDPDFDTITSTETGKTGLLLYRYIWNTATTVNIVLEAHDKYNNVLFTKTISNVQFYKNRKTILTGKLFNNTSTAQFSITANQAWGPDAPTINF
jgi:uncharacterized protein YcfL